MSGLDLAGVIARLLQFAAAAVLGGAPLFFVYGVAPRPSIRWPVRLVRFAAGCGALGTLGWLMAQAAQIGEGARDAFNPGMVWSLAADTRFGRAAAVRLGLFLAAFAATLGRSRGRAYWLSLAGLGAAASASLAWTGHGARDDGVSGVIHLTADVLHLLAASVWIGALAGLAVLVLQARRAAHPDAARDSLTGLIRFSGIGVAVVAVIVASGLVNSWYLIGVGGLTRVLTTPYGQLLIAKLVLLVLMLALAAANRYRHTPRLERALQVSVADGASFRPVMLSVFGETALAIAVLALVAWLGTLSPPVDA